MSRRNQTEDAMEPTPEQMDRGGFYLTEITDKRRGGTNVTIGKAWRRHRMLEHLELSGLLTDGEAKALRHYRHYADRADRSPLRDSIRTLLRIGGGGDEPSVGLLNAIFIRDDLERAAGSLADLLHAVFVDDASIEEIAMARLGSVEHVERKGGRSYSRIRPKRRHVQIVRLEVKIAAQRVEAELEATERHRETPPASPGAIDPRPEK